MKLKLLFLASIVFLFCNTIQAQNPPTARAKNITAKLDANGNVTVTAADLDNGSTDNTAIVSYMLTTAAVGTSCGQVNENQTLTLTAPAGSIFSAVNFASFGLPTGSCGDFVLGCNSPKSKPVAESALLSKNSGSILANNATFDPDPCPNTPKFLFVEAFYQPSIAVIQPSMSFTCEDKGDHTVNLIVTDTEGNKRSATATITVVDDLAPVIVCNTNIEVNNDPGICGAVVTFGKPVVTDNCSVSVPVVATFTNAGATGRFGPTQAQVDAAYGAGVVTINTQGIQEWKVPKTGKYSIQALGASGGNAPATNFTGGNGANISGEVDLTAGEIIKIVVGQQGQATTDNYGAGGGGGSFVTTFTNTAVVVAGGGGGAGQIDDVSKQASIMTTANNGKNGGNGGTALNGGDVGPGNNIAGGGGGGLNTNGSDGLVRTSKGGFSFLNGSTGGLNQLGSNGGGFGGGGGGANNCGYGGGGGGYSGGGPGGYSGGCGGNGGGAGSFNSGTNQNNTGGSNTGMGKVVITLLSTPIVISQTDVTGLASGSVFPVGTTTLKYTATDKSGNSSSCSFDIIVKDNEKPVIVSNGDKNVNTDTDVCGASVVVSASATDNCTVGTPTGVRSDAKLLSDVYPVGITTITWSVTDINTNDAVEVIQTVTVTDNQIPVIIADGDKNVNVDTDVCGANVVVSASATDNCTVGTPTGVRSDGKLLSDVYPVGITTITWSATDINTNDAVEVIQTVTVTDNQIPVIIADGNKNVNVDINLCGANVVVSASATDNCTVGTPTGVRSDAKLLSDVYPVGITTITWNVTDINTNDATEVIQTVTVTDNQVPVIITDGDKNVNVDINFCGANVIVSASATDNCTVGIPTGVRSDAKLLSDVYPVGITTITWNVTDVNRNNAVQVIQTVQVADNILPTVLTQNITVELDEAGNASIIASEVNNGSSDNCSIATYSLNKSSFDCTNLGANNVVLTVTDKSGNTATANATVTVKSTAGDNDNDGILDNCDPDDDNDGILDTIDNCPITANPYQEDRNNNGLGDACDKDQMNISEAFTPNGDGINDTWVVSNIENYPGSVVRVFNRWGAEVFVATNYQNDWDGHAKGNSSTLPAASSYYYQIDLDGNGTIDRQGWIYINR